VISRKGCRLASAVIGFGLTDKTVKLASFGVGSDLLIPEFLAKRQEPLGHSVHFARLEFTDGRFDFLNRAHGNDVLPCTVKIAMLIKLSKAAYALSMNEWDMV
jgi:hypothetical protein